MPVRSMTLTTVAVLVQRAPTVSDACQINDFDHSCLTIFVVRYVSDACQINDFDQVMRNSVRGTSVAVFWIASGVCF